MFQKKIFHSSILIEIIISEYQAGNITLDDQKKTTANIKNNNVGKNLLYIPNDSNRAKMFTEISNKKNFKRKEVGNVLLSDGKEWATSKSGLLKVETDSYESMEKALKKLDPTYQKVFMYLVNCAIQRGYESKLQVDINEILEVMGLTRKSSTIERIYEGLKVYTSVRFECHTVINKEERTGKQKRKKVVSYTLKTTNTLLSHVTLKKKGFHAKAIYVELNEWFHHLKQARETGDVYLLTLREECLKVDTKKYPYSFGSPYRMAQYARTNNKKKQEWHTLTLKSVIEGVEPWEDAVKKMKTYGFNHNKGRSLIERLTESLEHAEKPFKLKWEWVDGEPTTIKEAENAKIRFKFSQPLVNANKEDKKEPATE
jgi:hypothetical protein